MATTPAAAPLTPPPVIPITTHHHLPIKLSSTNFPSWRAHLLALLHGHDLVGYVDGTFICPSLAADGSNAAAVTTWIRQDQLLLAAIFGSLNPEVLPLVSSCDTSAAAWSALNRLFASKSCARVNQLKSDLYRITIGDRSISDYMHHVKFKVDELALIDQPVSLDDLTLFVINGLGPEYANIVGPIRTRETPLRFEKLHDLLIEHELSLRAQEKAHKNLVATANAVQSGGYRQNNNRRSHSGGYRGPTHQFGPRPHVSDTSRGGHHSNQQSSRGPSNPGCDGSYSVPSYLSRQPTMVYQLCGVTGHTTLQCGRPPYSAHYVASPTSPTSDQWLVDTGASHNVTNNLKNLSIHFEYDGTDSVQITDGTGLPITHTGSNHGGASC